ncbi:MAG TPA: ribonuclease R [Candidatus Choladousia intestinigallinarum]|nr:ribonuclease R [Candidatus Choladousia intestinigallinarum]
MGLTEEQFERRRALIYDLICDRHYVPMKKKEIASLLQIPKEERDSLQMVLESLMEEGKIEVTSRGKYRKTADQILTGTFTAHPRGFGFVQAEGREEDIFIPEDQTGLAMHLDTVQVRLGERAAGKRQEGTIVKILDHGLHQLVGTYEKRKNYGFVIPDNPRITSDIYISQENSLGAVQGHKVLLTLIRYEEKGKNPEGKVDLIIGHSKDPGTDILSVLCANGLPLEFPPKAEKEALRVPERVSDQEIEGRKDLRNVQMVTIDGEDARDLDDAVSLSFDGEHYHLGVHIADVSEYVREGTALDREALKRGTSVYLPDRVIPMLPPRLSNGICSLNEGEERLALSCMMEIDRKGEILSHEIAQTVIRVDRRMSYNQVKAILAQSDQGLMREFAPLVPMLQQMGTLSGLLRAKRKKRGSLDFDFPEAKLILDDRGVPVEIKPYEKNDATMLIEDFMLAANETVAQDFYWQEIPFLYRTHETPDPEKIKKLAAFIRNFGYGIKGITDEVHPKELQKLLARVADTPEEPVISRMTLRSMKQASYTVQCSGHFGLAARYYCHFTSPIRRYPDLQIHRIIKEVLRGKMTPERLRHYTDLLPSVAEQSSLLERRAEETERETVKIKKAEYMMERIGKKYSGIVTGITSYGMYVELPNTVEGLVHVSRMYDDRYYFQEETWELVGMDTGRVFRLGDSVDIRVVSADKMTKNIDFELIES